MSKAYKDRSQNKWVCKRVAVATVGKTLPAAALMNHPEVYTAPMSYITHTATGLRRAVTFLKSECCVPMLFSVCSIKSLY